MANADTTVNFACKRPYFADMGDGSQKLVKFCTHPLWMAQMAQGSNITLPQTLSLDISPKNINFLEDAMRGSIQEKGLMMYFKGKYLPHSSGHFDFTWGKGQVHGKCPQMSRVGSVQGKDVMKFCSQKNKNP